MMNSDFSLALIDGILTQRELADTLLSCNEKASAYGLVLTAQQAMALANTQADMLKKTGRIEFGSGVIHKLILAFCDSPYITQINYEDTLHELIDLFYSFKNETLDCVSDNALIEYMKKEFNGECRGSLELLAGDALPALVRKLNERRGADPFEKMEITDD
ncbi:MAG: DUF6323 family protein [Lachnospiraceae bacterium]|nr:DUF6323 family protein [Lachnospiraceae bacterium]